MHWQYTPYALPLFLVAAIVIALIPYLWRRRTAPGTTALIVLMLAAAEWSLGYTLELIGADLATKVFWAKIEYLGIVTMPLVWLAFALQYTNRDGRLTARNLVLLSVIPLVTLVLVWSNEWHALIWTYTELDASGPFPALDAAYGPWFWVHTAFSYLLLLLASIQLLAVLLRSPQLYRRQSGALLLGMLLPWVSNGLYLSGLVPVRNLDLTPFAFSLSGVVFAVGLFRFRLLDIVPVARQAILNGMGDGVMVLDTQNRIVYLNPAVQRLIGFSAAEAIGKPASQVLTNHVELARRYRDVTDGQAEITLWSDLFGTRFSSKPQDEGDVPHHYELRISPLTDREDHLVARVVLLHDITTRKRVEAALRAARDELETRVEERTTELAKLTKDLLSEISERVRAEKALNQKAQELARSGAFIAALSQVAAHINVTPDLDQILKTLGNELRQLGITCFVALLEPDSGELVNRYLSSEPTARRLAEESTGFTLEGIRIPLNRWPISEIIKRKQAVFVPDASLVVESWLPDMPQPIVERIFEALDFGSETALFQLPLMMGEQVVGTMGIWGTDLREDDLTAVSIFANQVAAALENARLYEQAQKELTERMRAEELVKASLREKEILLQEIHHRVKNNLQVISSLLSLQSDYIQDARASEIFRDSQHRVRSMALIHEKLYQSESLARVDLAEYIRDLVAYLFRAHNASAQGITSNVRAEKVFLEVGTAVPCGLILNELVSNSLQHAFPLERDRPDSRTGEIHIKLSADRGGQVTLVVADNGAGLAPDLDFRDTSSLGLQLVNILVKQLDGAIELDHSTGTEFKITFTAS